MRRRKQKLLGWFAGLILFLSFSGFKGQQAQIVPVVFDTCSEYIILSALENEIAVLASKQEQSMDDGSEDIQGMDVTKLPDYVTRYPELYAPEEAKIGEEIQQPEGKIAYLSFDDGPSEQTITVLDILKEEGIHATFFLIGEEITPEREDIVRRIVNEGHTIGLHTYCHNYEKLYSSVDAFLEDYEKVCLKIYEVAGVRPSIFRFPGGSRNHYGKKIVDSVAEEMERRGYCYYDWNVSAEDSVGKPTSYSIRANIFKDVFRYDTPVILMHDSATNALTVSMLADIIKEIKEAGYEFDTLDNRECCQF